MGTKDEVDEVAQKRMKMAIRKFRQRAREELDARRPERYDIDDAHNFIDGVAEDLAEILPAQHTAVIAARQLVGRIEGEIVRNTPDLLGKLFDAGQMPMDWYKEHLYKSPVMISETVRVRYDIMTPDDHDKAETFQLRQAAAATVSGSERASQFRRASDMLRDAGLENGGSLHVVAGVIEEDQSPVE